MVPEIIRNEEAKKAYVDINKLCRKVNIDNPSIKDEDLVNKVLGSNLITNPINNDEPFSVINKTDIEGFDGRDFSIDSLKLSAADTPNGGRFDIQFTATPPFAPYAYNLDVTLNQSPYAIRVKKSNIESL